MNKRLKFNLVLLSGLLYALPAHADIEAIQATINATVVKAQAVLKQVQDIKTDVLKAKDEATQGFNSAKKSISNIKDIKLDPKDFVKTAVMQGMKDNLDEKPNEDENIENVKGTYNRNWGEEHNNTTARELREAINKENQQAAAELYARALILRQSLLDEKDYDDSLDTIEEAFEASKNMQLRSLARWEKIMSMQSYINAYKSVMQIQNYENEAQDSEEEGKDEEI